MAKMKKLLEKLTAQLNVPITRETKFPKTPKIFVEPAAMISSKNRQNLTDLEYFNPLFDKLYANNDIVIVNKKTQIQDMHLFMNQVRNLVEIKKGQIVQNNLNTALKDRIQVQYMIKLSNLKCSAFCIDTENQINM